MLDAPLSGVLAFVYLAAVPVSLALTAATRALYRRSVTRLMMTSGGPQAPFYDPPLRPPDRRYLQCIVAPEQMRSPLRTTLGVRYLAAGLVFGLSAAIVWFVVNDVELGPVRFTVTALVMAWPAVPFAIHVAGVGKLGVAAGSVVYTTLLAIVEPLALPALVLLVLPAALIGLVLANRLLRTTSVTMYLIAIVLVVPLLFSLDIALLLVADTGEAALPAAFLVTLVAGVVLGLGVARLMAAASRNASDLMIQSDAIWLILALWLVALSIGETGIRALALFIALPAYRVALHLPSVRRRATHPPLLLLLRVFGRQKAQEELSFGLLTDWRLQGPVMLIGAADLATETLDPSELSAFLNFSTSSIFITSPDDLDQRLRQSVEPAADGLFPLRDYYCQPSTWQPTVTLLMGRASSVVLDLRGFGPANAGVQWEIAQLVRHVPIEQIVVLSDETTDMAFAEQVFVYEWYQYTGYGHPPPGAPEAATAKLSFRHQAG